MARHFVGLLALTYYANAPKVYSSTTEMTDMFAEAHTLTTAYLALKGNPTKEGCAAVMHRAIVIIDGCKKAKQDVYDFGPSVHGARQHSRLDMLDIWQGKAEAVYDNAMAMQSALVV